MACSRPGPGHDLGADPLAMLAVQATDLGLQIAPAGGKVQVSPAPDVAVVGGPGPPSTGAGEPGPPPTKADHDAFGAEAHAGHAGAGDAQHLVECSTDAHARRLLLVA